MLLDYICSTSLTFDIKCANCNSRITCRVLKLQQHRLKKEGKKSQITDDRIAKLDDIGMKWVVTDPHSWESKLDPVVLYVCCEFVLRILLPGPSELENSLLITPKFLMFWLLQPLSTFESSSLPGTQRVQGSDRRLQRTHEERPAPVGRVGWTTEEGVQTQEGREAVCHD